jgi:hypothetical protein
MDLMSYQSIVSKVGHLKDLFIPVSRSGERGIEFDMENVASYSNV